MSSCGLVFLLYEDEWEFMVSLKWIEPLNVTLGIIQIDRFKNALLKTTG